MEALPVRPTTVAFVLISLSSLLVVCLAKCSPCTFQWRQHQHHCYRYFHESLQYDQAKAFCRRFASGGSTGELAAVGSTEELIFLMDYIGAVLNGTSDVNIPEYVWLDKTGETYENYNLIFFNALSESQADGHFDQSCDSRSPEINVLMSELDTGLSFMVAAPEVVERSCAVYVGEGAYIDLGDFAGKCVSDPDVCVSQSVTWSIWIKIKSSADRSGERYFVSSGGQTKSARGIFFNYKSADDRFQFGARSLRKSWSYVLRFVRTKIPLDRWFYLAATVDLTHENAELVMYLDGTIIAPDNEGDTTVSNTDSYTKLYLGNSNKLPGSSKASSAAYSNLMVFDHLLTPEQIKNLYSCGSLDWGINVRSLYRNHTNMYSNLHYVCTASASTGPIIYWRMYHTDTSQWEDLEMSTEGVQITSTSFSTCVIQSVLVIDSSRTSSNEGDIISCIARTGTLNASVYIRQGRGEYLVYSDHGHNKGLIVSQSGHQPFYKSSENEVDGASYPFICEKEGRDKLYNSSKRRNK